MIMSQINEEYIKGKLNEETQRIREDYRRYIAEKILTEEARFQAVRVKLKNGKIEKRIRTTKFKKHLKHLEWRPK